MVLNNHQPVNERDYNEYYSNENECCYENAIRFVHYKNIIN